MNTPPSRMRGYDVKKPQKYFKLYYRTRQYPRNTVSNASETVFVTNPIADDIYRGNSNMYMTDSDYLTYNKNILSFSGVRTPADMKLSPEMRVPRMYDEFVNISVQPYDLNYIQAHANYIDEGSGFETTVPFVNYTVTGASGIFEGCTNLRIEFFDKNPPMGPNGPLLGLGPVRNVIIT